MEEARFLENAPPSRAPRDVSSARKSGFQPDSADEHLARRAANHPPDRTQTNSTDIVDFGFRGFDPQQPIVQKRGHLPHWEQPRCNLLRHISAGGFTSGRCSRADGETNATAWLKLHPQPWDWKTAREYMRRFEEEREHWLDQGHGSCLLREPQAAAIVADVAAVISIGKRYVIDCFVVMPNHVHVLFKPLGEHSLVDILHSWKSFTANVLNRKMNREGALWMHESFDTIVRDAEHLRVCRRLHCAKSQKSTSAQDAFVLDRRDGLSSMESSEVRQLA